jgi:Ring finger domain
VIAVIGVLASAFLLVTYYAVVSRYCNPGSRLSFHRRDNSSADQPASRGSDYPTAWHVLPSNGLDEAVIKKIAIWKYEKGGLDGKVGSDCSVCLSEFTDGEDVRLLPKCTHAFHVQCIDTWLKSHSNCPLCRASIIPTQQEDTKESETVVNVSDSSTNSDVNGNRGTGSGSNVEEIIEIGDESEGNDNVGPRIRRSLSMDSDRESGTRISIADILQLSMEDELMVAKESGLLVTGPGSSRRNLEPHRKDHMRFNVLPVPMKRSLSGGRLFRNGRGRECVLPIWDNSSVR